MFADEFLRNIHFSNLKQFRRFEKMNENYEQKNEETGVIKPRARKALVIEWPDQRTVFEKNKGRGYESLK